MEELESFTSTITMTTSLASSKSFYLYDINNGLNDINAIDFTGFFDAEDDDEMKEAVAELRKEITSLNFSTKEGNELKSVFLNYVASVEDFVDESIKLKEKEDVDGLEDLLDDFYDDISDLEDDLEDALEDFLDAAEDAGVDEDVLEDFDF